MSYFPNVHVDNDAPWPLALDRCGEVRGGCDRQAVGLLRDITRLEKQATEARKRTAEAEAEQREALTAAARMAGHLDGSEAARKWLAELPRA